MESSNCVFCESQLNLAYQAKDINDKAFDFFRCSHCGTLQMAEINQELFSYAYDSQYYGAGLNKFKWPYSSLFAFSKKMSAKKLSKWLSSKEDKILDIGAGRGDFLLEMQALGYENTWGAELEVPENSHSKIHWIEGDLNDFEGIEGGFNLITLFHVFEHLEGPLKIIETIKKLLAPNGVLVIAIPNGASEQCKNYGPDWLHLDPPRHLHLVPPNYLNELCIERGFQLKVESYKSFFYNPFGELQSWLNQRSEKRDFLYENLKTGRSPKGFREHLTFFTHLLFAGMSFPFFIIKDRAESKREAGATVELIYQLKS